MEVYNRPLSVLTACSPWFICVWFNVNYAHVIKYHFTNVIRNISGKKSCRAMIGPNVPVNDPRNDDRLAPISRGGGGLGCSAYSFFSRTFPVCWLFSLSLYLSISSYTPWELVAVVRKLIKNTFTLSEPRMSSLKNIQKIAISG